jgi:hypothetical protein
LENVLGLRSRISSETPKGETESEKESGYTSMASVAQPAHDGPAQKSVNQDVCTNGKDGEHAQRFLRSGLAKLTNRDSDRNRSSAFGRKRNGRHWWFAVRLLSGVPFADHERCDLVESGPSALEATPSETDH